MRTRRKKEEAVTAAGAEEGGGRLDKGTGQERALGNKVRIDRFSLH
jgi:hypothetical protein